MTRREHDVVFVCLAQNVAPTLPGFLEFLRALELSGSRVKAIVGENGSRDGTRKILTAAEAEGWVRLVDTGFLSAIGNRFARLAVGREKLKQVLDSSDLRPRFVCVADLDSVMAQPPAVHDFNAALDLLRGRPELFAAAATSRPLFYDLIAYEDDRVSFAGLPRQVAAARRNLLTYHRFVVDSVYSRLAELTSDAERSCISSFNGACVYAAEAYRGGSYLSGTQDICEHLVFNRSIAHASGRRMVITPLLRLATPPEHLPSGPAMFWARRILRLARSRMA